MLLCKISKLDRGSCRWTCLDTFLMVVAGVCVVITLVCAFTVLPRWYPDDDKHEGGKPRYHHAKCRVEEIDFTGETGCSKDDDGEWCELKQIAKRQTAPGGQAPSSSGGQQPPPGGQDPGKHSGEPGEHGGEEHGEGKPGEGHEDGKHEGPDGEGHKEPYHDDDDDDDMDWGSKSKEGAEHGASQPGGSGHHSGRSFPCMRVSVSYERRGGGGRRRGRMHGSLREAENFPSCSESSCGEWWSDNEDAINHKKERWEQLKQKGDEFDCYYNEKNEEEVLEDCPGFWMVMKSPAFHSVLWPSLLALLCILIVIIRRCCFACKDMYHEEHKIDIAKTDAFIASALSNPGYVEDGKKKGLPDVDAPQPLTDLWTLNSSAPPAYGQVIGVPPAYEAIIRPAESKYKTIDPIMYKEPELPEVETKVPLF